MWVSLSAAGRYIFSLDAVAMDVRTVSALGIPPSRKTASGSRSTKPRCHAVASGNDWDFSAIARWSLLRQLRSFHLRRTQYSGNGYFVEYGKTLDTVIYQSRSVLQISAEIT